MKQPPPSSFMAEASQVQGQGGLGRWRRRSRWGWRWTTPTPSTSSPTSTSTTSPSTPTSSTPSPTISTTTTSIEFEGVGVFLALSESAVSSEVLIVRDWIEMRGWLHAIQSLLIRISTRCHLVQCFACLMNCKDMRLTHIEKARL
uniref:Uncharacterized protein n=1 Tax=Ananas comosus var. bracteatus TaxID=296719 RepID=A0A6V7NR30_ANACO|nr:unnamed protein product [Ananas comosus var. bracteatus]